MNKCKNKLHEEIYDEARKIEKITEEVKKKCIEVAHKERLTDHTGESDDIAYNKAIRDVIRAIQGV